MLPRAVWEKLLVEGERRVERALEESVEREGEAELRGEVEKKGWVTVLKGVRRAGKTTLAMRLSRGYDVAYVDFEHPYVMGMIGRDDLITLFHIVEGKEVVILDEVQHVEGWELFARRAVENKGPKVIVTGSTAYLIGKEYGRQLTGRRMEHMVYPFSFREALHLRPNLKLEDYLLLGGFPEVVKERSRELALQYRNDILFRDVLGSGVRKQREVMALYAYLLDNPGMVVSRKRVGGLMDLSANTLRNYLHLLESTFVVLAVRKHNQPRAPPKVYPVDNGLTNTQSMGLRLETAVLHALVRMGLQPTYIKEKHWEVDFVVGRKPIQVAYELTRKNIERELKPLERLGGGVVIAAYGYESISFPKGVEVVDATLFLREPERYKALLTS